MLRSWKYANQHLLTIRLHCRSKWIHEKFSYKNLPNSQSEFIDPITYCRLFWNSDSVSAVKRLWNSLWDYLKLKNAFSMSFGFTLAWNLKIEASIPLKRLNRQWKLAELLMKNRKRSNQQVWGELNSSKSGGRNSRIISYTWDAIMQGWWHREYKKFCRLYLGER